jgi:hypothetical protein
LEDLRDVLDAAMPQLAGLDGCITTTIVLCQGMKESLHHPFDFRCIGIHAALLRAPWREGLVSYFRETGKLIPARSLRFIDENKENWKKVRVFDSYLSPALPSTSTTVIEK